MKTASLMERPLLGIRLGLWVALIFPLTLLFGFGFFVLREGFFWQDALTFLLFYQWSLFGISVGSHRYFSHRSFHSPAWFEFVLFAAASSALQYSPLSWAAFHRQHHRFADQPGDPHSPWVDKEAFENGWNGWVHAHFLWAFSYDFDRALKEYLPDFLAKPHLRALHRFHYPLGLSFVVAAGVFEWLILDQPGAFWRGLFWGGLFRIFILHNSIFFLNSILGHRFGYKNFDLSDKSTNNPALFPFLLGEAWHHNHHAEPAAADNRVRFFEIDPHFVILRGIERVGIIRSLKKRPPSTPVSRR